MLRTLITSLLEEIKKAELKNTALLVIILISGSVTYGSYQFIEKPEQEARIESTAKSIDSVKNNMNLQYQLIQKSLEELKERSKSLADKVEDQNKDIKEILRNGKR